MNVELEEESGHGEHRDQLIIRLGSSCPFWEMRANDEHRSMEDW
jgi:hypothetical protein